MQLFLLKRRDFPEKKIFKDDMKNSKATKTLLIIHKESIEAKETL